MSDGSANAGTTSTDKPVVAVRKRSHYIFTIAYVPRGLRSLLPDVDVPKLQNSLPFIRQYLCDLFAIAPSVVGLYSACYLLYSAVPALSVYLCYATLKAIRHVLMHPVSSTADHGELHLWVGCWLSMVLLSPLSLRVISKLGPNIRGHLKYHFAPQLVKASLSLDVAFRHEVPFPDPVEFGHYAPGWSFIYDLSHTLNIVLTLTFALFVIAFIAFKEYKDRNLALLTMVLGFVFMKVLSPNNAFGGAGYVFTTDDKVFHRLNNLFHLSFDAKYRAALMKDNVGPFVYDDEFKGFKRTSTELGVMKTDTLVLSGGMLPHLGWDILFFLFVDQPVLLYSLTLLWSFSAASVMNIILFQQTTSVLNRILGCSLDLKSLVDSCDNLRILYDALQEAEKRDMPGDISKHPRAMRISFRNITLRDKDGKNVFERVSFDIEPGKFVLVVGNEGSGKTALLHLIAGLAKATSGSIKIDGKPLEEHDLTSLRSSIAFHMQSECLYPLTVRENLLLGQPWLSGTQDRELIEEAARLGGCLEVIADLGHDTVLNSKHKAIPYRCIEEVGSGKIHPEALRERRRGAPYNVNASISVAQQQHLTAARAIVKLLGGGVRLLMMDDATSGLDSATEEQVIGNMRKVAKGITVILVNKRFARFAKEADLILCMDRGRVAELGKHAELMGIQDGLYAKLYNAQAGKSE